MSEKKIYYSIEAMNISGDLLLARTTLFLSEAREYKDSMMNEYYCYTAAIPHKVVIKEYSITIDVVEVE